MGAAMTFDDWWKQTKPAECDELKAYFLESWNTSAAQYTADLDRLVEAAVGAENIACQRLCEKLGMATNGMYERNHKCAMAIKARRDARRPELMTHTRLT